MFDPELESFKTSIDLRAYAATQGYVLDRKESWRGGAVMRHPAGDKVIITRGADAHYVYFSIRDQTDHGTIIDFVRHRLHLNLGALRKQLRAWVDGGETPPYPPLLPTAKNRMHVEAAYARMQDASTHPYLENERAIPAAMLQSERFAGRVRIDARGNAIFAHFDQDGLCGFEIKNRGFTGFAPGGRRGLWFSQSAPRDNRLVFCESAIDALSYAVLFPEDRTRYASMGGQLSTSQHELLRAAAAAMPLNAKIIGATDADAPGAKLADIIRKAVELTGRDDLISVLHRPDGFKDWNDRLRNRPCRSVGRQFWEPSVR